MPILEPRSTAGDKGSGLYVLVISLTLCCWAWSAHGCDQHGSADWANGTSVRKGSAGAEDVGLEGLSPSFHLQYTALPCLGWPLCVEPLGVSRVSILHTSGYPHRCSSPRPPLYSDEGKRQEEASLCLPRSLLFTSQHVPITHSMTGAITATLGTIWAGRETRNVQAKSC